MKNILVWAACVIHFSSITYAEITGPLTSRECRGGDGPTPLTLINNPSSLNKIETSGEVQEFLYWPRRQALVYRSEGNNLYFQGLRDAFTKRLSTIDAKLSRVTDKDEHIILQSGLPRYLDLSYSNLWQQYAEPFPEAHHLFWEKDVDNRNILYGLGTTVQGATSPSRAYSLAEGGKQTSSCELSPRGAYQLAEGNVFPYVYLYQTKRVGDSTQLSFFRIRLNRGMINSSHCPVMPFAKALKVKGRVKAVQFFKEGNSVAILTDQRASRVVSIDTNHCFQFDLGGREAFFLGRQDPILAVWALDEGVQLMALDTKEYQTVLSQKLYEPVLPEHMLLSEEGNDLFLNVKTESDLPKQLYTKWIY